MSHMAVDYYQWHRHFMFNTNYIEETKKFLVENSQKFGLDELKTMVSIGPGYGEIDAAIVNKCADKLEHYIGVERDQYSLDKLSAAIGKRPKLEVSLVREEFPGWKGPAEGVDLILVSHVLYFIDDHVAAIKQFYEWLNPGGAILIIQSCGKNLYTEIAESSGLTVQLYVEEGLRNDLRKAGFHNFDEYILDSTMKAGTQDDEMVKSYFRNKVYGLPEDELDTLVGLFRSRCEKDGYDLLHQDICIRLIKPNHAASN